MEATSSRTIKLCSIGVRCTAADKQYNASWVRMWNIPVTFHREFQSEFIAYFSHYLYLSGSCATVFKISNRFSPVTRPQVVEINASDGNAAKTAVEPACQNASRRQWRGGDMPRLARRVTGSRGGGNSPCWPSSCEILARAQCSLGVGVPCTAMHAAGPGPADPSLPRRRGAEGNPCVLCGIGARHKPARCD